MNTQNHTVTIPIDDYNELINSSKDADKKISHNKEYIERLNIKKREFVSALVFLEEKGLSAEFNAKINKSYMLAPVGFDKDYKHLVNP